MSHDDEHISSLYHQADKPEPAAELDEAILAASRKAVDKPAKAGGPFTGGWPAAASVAAVIVIAVILVPVLKQQEPVQSPPPPMQQPASPAPQASPELRKTTEARERKADAFAPASEPLLLKEEAFTADEALPAGAVFGTGTASPAEADEYRLPEMEESAVSPAPAAGRVSKKAADSAPMAIFTPEMWETKIMQLIEHDDVEQAKAELAKLRQQHPDHSINTAIIQALE